MILKSWEAIFALLNGMAKGVILILPLFALQSGWLQTIILILLSGYFSFYSCYVYILHLGIHSDIDKSIFYHFWNSKAITTFYNITVFLNLLLILVSYFILIVEQWQGLISDNVLIPICNIIFLFLFGLFLKYIHFGGQTLGYGLISVFVYCLFLIWNLATAPTGKNTMPIFGPSFTPTAAAVTQAFSIQQFFIPVLKELHISQTKNFSKLTLIVFLLGGVIYIFICLVGAYGILNRNAVPPVKSIESYFDKGQWQVIVIQVIYLIHLYTGFVWFLFNAKKRLFCVFHMLWRIKNSKPRQFFTGAEIIFIIFCLGVCLLFYFFGVPINIVIEINGGIIGFFFIYLIPALMQFKCLYLPRPKPIFQIVYDLQTGKPPKQFKQGITLSKSSSLDSKKDTQFVREDSDISRYTSISKQIFKDKINFSEECKNDTKLPLIELQQVSPQPEKRPPPQFIDLLSLSHQSARNEKISNPYEDQIIGADVSADLSARQSTVSIISYRCIVAIPSEIGIKILDILSISGMLLFGLFTMVVSIINIKSQV